jgi:hypothetical protein
VISADKFVFRVKVRPSVRNKPRGHDKLLNCLAIEIRI